MFRFNRHQKSILNKTLLFGILVLALSGCQTTHNNPNLTLTSESEYFSAVKDSTERKQIYDGFHAAFEFYATLMNTKVSRLQVDQYARIYQWSELQYSSEKSKRESELSNLTTIFFSFYVPDRKLDDLNKPKTLWKIFLDVSGKRYEGKAEKLKTLPAELVALYPHFNRWSTPYKITFSLPTSMAEASESKLTLTGPAGSTTVEFAPAN
jgi:hypothetical protein